LARNELHFNVLLNQETLTLLKKFFGDCAKLVSFPLKIKKEHQHSLNPAALSDSELLRENKIKCAWHDLYYGNVNTLADLISAKKILEVGVAWGYHAEFLLVNMPKVKYVGIDPYLAGYDNKDAFPKFVADLFNSDEQDSMNRLHAAVKSGFDENYPGRIRLIREKSISFAENCDEKFDLIFLDGDHTYLSVLQELKVFWVLLEQNGIICGDDYDWPDVKKAVDQFAQEKNLITHFLSKESRGYPTYFFKKQNLNQQ